MLKFAAVDHLPAIIFHDIACELCKLRCFAYHCHHILPKSRPGMLTTTSPSRMSSADTLAFGAGAPPQTYPNLGKTAKHIFCHSSCKYTRGLSWKSRYAQGLRNDSSCSQGMRSGFDLRRFVAARHLRNTVSGDCKCKPADQEETNKAAKSKLRSRPNSASRAYSAALSMSATAVHVYGFGWARNARVEVDLDLEYRLGRWRRKERSQLGNKQGLGSLDCK